MRRIKERETVNRVIELRYQLKTEADQNDLEELEIAY